MYEEEDLLPISGLQHLAFCARQCALIHLENQWAENRLTVEGKLLHAKAHEEGHETRAGVRVERAVRLQSRRLGLTGQADVIEIERATGAVRPVEYKRGKPKRGSEDEVQLCAQALCLEEMRGVQIGEGDLFYGTPRRRTVVAFDAALRRRTEELAARFHELVRRGVTPGPEYGKKCGSCSLEEICQPRAMEGARAVEARWRRALAEART